MARNSFTTPGGASTEEYRPKVDKNPFYRTTDILNQVFKKRVRLDAGPANSTDLQTIWVNFNEVFLRPIQSRQPFENGKHHYTLECGHPWESKNEYPVGKYIPCWTCGTGQAYLGFEHEWEHIVFKSNLIARKLFVDQYAAQLLQQAPHLDKPSVEQFLHLFINAFDDIRVNSLQEKVYPGSAHRIWERWRRLLKQTDFNNVFLAYAMAVGLGVDTDPKSDFAPLKPILEWGMQKARYRGFGTMLLDIRVVIDRCVGALLTQAQPPPPQQGQPQPAQQQGGQNGQAAQQPNAQPGSSDAGDQAQGDPGADSDGGAPSSDDSSDQDGDGRLQDASQGDTPVPPPDYAPSASHIHTDPYQTTKALIKLIVKAKPLDDGEDHKIPSADDVAKDPSRIATASMVAQALNADIFDLDKIDAAMPADVPDQDMQQAIDALMQAGSGPKAIDGQLKDDARARISFIDVMPQNIDNRSYVELSDTEQMAVDRLRAVFFRELGKKKAKRGITGATIDIPAFIQFKIDRKDPEVFEEEGVNQGFAYHVLCDMSGSMAGLFSIVGAANTILKQALDFPFVQGSFWGFRGAETTNAGEVWLYRFHKGCKGYAGRVGSIRVGCGGITPMNSALRVSIKHLRTHTPVGMAKRLYLITDGSPYQVRVSGKGLSDKLLRQFVAKEIKLARSRGIDVYSIVIGSGITDDDAKQMFGHTRYWRRASTELKTPDSVGNVLTQLVMSNFSKYLRSR